QPQLRGLPSQYLGWVGQRSYRRLCLSSSEETKSLLKYKRKAAILQRLPVQASEQQEIWSVALVSNSARRKQRQKHGTRAAVGPISMWPRVRRFGRTQSCQEFALHSARKTWWVLFF